jgi:hypothetical protein
MSGFGRNAASIIQLGGVMRFRGMRTAIRMGAQKKRAAQWPPGNINLLRLASPFSPCSAPVAVSS